MVNHAPPIGTLPTSAEVVVEAACDCGLANPHNSGVQGKHAGMHVSSSVTTSEGLGEPSALATPFDATCYPGTDF